MSETPSTRKAALWVAIVFLLGATLGGMVGYGYAHRSVSAASAPAPEAERRARGVARLTRELSLTNDQAKELDAIVAQWHAEMKVIHDQNDARLEQERQKGRDEVRAILTPEQKPKYEEFLRKHDEERKRNAPK
jgi:Spy/CpxP family protein refolding chaperone